MTRGEADGGYLARSGVPVKGWENLRELTRTELIDDGIVHAVNEQFFWPLGLTLSVRYNRETGEVHSLRLSSTEPAEAIVSGLDPETHKARHAAFGAWRKARRERP